MNVLIWAEDKPLPEHAEKYRELYPDGIQTQLAAVVRGCGGDVTVRTATMQDAEQGLSQAALDWADVLVYWSHKHWREVADEHVDAMQARVLEGMGLVVLHSAHASRIFARLMGTRTQSLRWRENDERQRYWIVDPAHPIAEGLQGEYFEIPMDETYGEYFEIPQPERQVFITAAAGGEIFRSGCCWTRGLGRIFYFQGGHETYPVYMQREVQTVLQNAVRWACRREPNAAFPRWARQAPPLGV